MHLPRHPQVHSWGAMDGGVRAAQPETPCHPHRTLPYATAPVLTETVTLVIWLPTMSTLAARPALSLPRQQVQKLSSVQEHRDDSDASRGCPSATRIVLNHISSVREPVSSSRANCSSYKVR